MKKRLVVCLDGTWNTPDGVRGPSNVVKIMRAIRATGRDGISQVTFYDAGVGTAGGRISRAMDGAFGKGLDENVRDGYRFLAHNYEPGDEIYLFGFSRGAFTARSLAGFISACGLLPKHRIGALMRTWDLYQQPAEVRRRIPAYRELRRFSRFDLKITCLGVWDTVGALGVPLEPLQFLNRKYAFHDAELSEMVQAGFHALAIDEKRGPFQPTLWQKKKGHDLKGQVVEQVWFPGVHNNVGGGAADARLSELALSWMIDRVRAHSDLDFDPQVIASFNRDDVHGEIYESRTPLYAVSRLHPFRRLIGQNGVGRRLLQRLTERHNRPGDGCEFINEMIHWSAADRFGKEAVENGQVRVYAPENLKAALEADVPIVGPDDQRLGPTSLPLAAE